MWAAKIAFAILFFAAFYVVKEPLIDIHRAGIEEMHSRVRPLFDSLNNVLGLGLPPLFEQAERGPHPEQAHVGDKPRTLDELVESLQQVRPLVTYVDAPAFEVYGATSCDQ